MKAPVEDFLATVLPRPADTGKHSASPVEDFLATVLPRPADTGKHWGLFLFPPTFVYSRVYLVELGKLYYCCYAEGHRFDSPFRCLRATQHCDCNSSKQPQRSHVVLILFLLVHATYIRKLFFMHIPFMVNRAFSTTLTERLQHLQQRWARFVETTEREETSKMQTEKT